MRISACTRRVCGSTRSSTWRSASATHTDPKPELIPPRFSARVTLPITFGLETASSSPQRRPPTATHGDDEQRGDRDGRGRAGRGHAVAHAGQPPPRGAAALVAQRGLAELQLQPCREVLAHGWCLPILRRAVASPRLTRLRTTASLVCSSPAISS